MTPALPKKEAYMDPELEKALSHLNDNTDKVIDKANKALADAETLHADINARMEAMEIAGQRPGFNGQRNAKDKAFAAYLRHGPDAIGDEHRSNLAVSPDTGGGYLTEGTVLEREILKEIAEHSPIRQYANVKSIAAGGVTLPKLTGRPTGYWVGENEERTGTDLSYGQASIEAHEASCYVDISQKLIEDSVFDIEAEVAEEIGTEFARLEAIAFTSGNGFKRPKGYLTEDGIARVKSGGATSLTADGLVDLYHALPSAYARNAIWGMNRKTMGAARKLKTGDGTYLWQESLQAGTPSTILGRPVVEFPDQPDVGAGFLPIVFGDFSGYRVLDRVGFSLLRDPYTQAHKGNIRIIARRRVGGAAVQLDKFRFQEVGTV